MSGREKSRRGGGGELVLDLLFHAREDAPPLRPQLLREAAEASRNKWIQRLAFFERLVGDPRIRLGPERGGARGPIVLLGLRVGAACPISTG